MFFILVDAFSKWPEIHILKDITSKTTIKKLKEIFSIFGLPRTLVSDNGTSLTSLEFESFLKENGIFHKLSAPYHPATNGQAERYVQILKHSLEKMCCNKYVELEVALFDLLTQYRCMPHAFTHKAPSEILFKCKPRCKLDLLKLSELIKSEKVNNREVTKSFCVGEKVICRNYTGKDKWYYGTVIKKDGALYYLIELDDKKVWKRNANQIDKIGQNVKNKNVNSDFQDYWSSEGPRENVIVNNNNMHVNDNEQLFNRNVEPAPAVPRYALRTANERRLPARLNNNDFVIEVPLRNLQN